MPIFASGFCRFSKKIQILFKNQGDLTEIRCLKEINLSMLEIILYV